MKIVKEATAADVKSVCADDMLKINEFSKKTLTNDKVFTFEILLCDNDIDRDYERFDMQALEDLSRLFVGKTGIFDHEWSAKGQVARIYKTEVIKDPVKTAASGEPYAYLKAWAYMLKEGNDALIAEIEGGIKREVSIGCSMKSAVCSICGEEVGSAKCGHVRGGEYNGKICSAVLSGAEDAYEWSFVAVPAQKNAGVMKKYGTKKAETLAECVKNAKNEAVRKEYEKLSALAKMGENYLKGLRADVIRLGVLSDSGFDSEFLEKMAEKMDESELISFKRAFERKAEEIYPSVCQLKAREKGENLPSVGEFLI